MRDGLGQRFGRQQRLHEGDPVLQRVQRQQRHDRLAHPSGELVQPQRDHGAEAAHQASARHAVEVRQPVEPQAAQHRHGVGRQAQGGDGQGTAELQVLAGRQHAGGIACGGVGGAGRVRDGGAGHEAVTSKPGGQLVRQCRLTAEQMCRARNVQP